MAVTGISMYYRQALEKGHMPEDGWLHPVFPVIEGGRDRISGGNGPVAGRSASGGLRRRPSK